MAEALIGAGEVDLSAADGGGRRPVDFLCRHGAAAVRRETLVRVWAAAGPRAAWPARLAHSFIDAALGSYHWQVSSLGSCHSHVACHSHVLLLSLARCAPGYFHLIIHWHIVLSAILT